MKKLLSLILVTILLCGCTAHAHQQEGGMKVICTSFALYDWAVNISGGNADITYLLSAGEDMHSFQPTADDIINITTCDVLIYTGGESDIWIDEAVQKGASGQIVRLMDRNDLSLEEEEVEGMQSAEEDEEEEAYDEHIWLSPARAPEYCKMIADGFIKADPANAAAYTDNLNRYTAALDALNAEYSELSGGTFIVADRFPFRYLAHDCGLEYYAAFSGCSAESEASFETVTFLTDKANELKVPVIFVIDGSDGRLARTIADGCETAPETVVLDSMQSVKSTDEYRGYIERMEYDLEQLKKGVAHAES